ncbi:hypothetical protein, partial [Enterococcus faecium]
VAAGEEGAASGRLVKATAPMTAHSARTPSTIGARLAGGMGGATEDSVVEGASAGGAAGASAGAGTSSVGSRCSSVAASGDLTGADETGPE